jgi:hypothetical protein
MAWGGPIPSVLEITDVSLWKAHSLASRADMGVFFSTQLRLFFHVFRSKGSIRSEIALLKKENEILLTKMGKKKVHFGFYDRLFLVVLNRTADIKCRLTPVRPETVLSWQRTLITRFWTFEHALDKRGRKPIDTDNKNLILSMKNDNLLWGVLCGLPSLRIPAGNSSTSS